MNMACSTASMITVITVCRPHHRVKLWFIQIELRSREVAISLVSEEIKLKQQQQSIMW